jgi:hypothetical protein
MRVPPGLLAALGFVAAGCASGRLKVEHHSDGAVRLSCRVSLSECLAYADWVCEHRHYIVLRAVDEYDRPSGGLNGGVRTSEALLRCGPQVWPIGFEPMGTSAPVCPAPAPAAAPLSPVRCLPGSTQACVGPGGASGGQSCLADGSGYGPCDIGHDGGQP